MSKILIISNDVQHSRTLKLTLSYNGFVVESAPTLEEAWRSLQQIHFDLLLIDVHFKEGNGLDFCRELRHLGMRAALVTMGECYDEVTMLEGMKDGSDDYILRPFGLSELKMIINKQLERKRLRAAPIIVGELRIDVARGLVMVKNRIVSLGRKELEILILMSQKAGRIVSCDRLVTEARMRILSKKLKDAAGEALQIKFVQGLGYKLIACG